MEEEEGLDEREPEKAICADRYHILTGGHQLIEEIKHQVIQIKQNEASTITNSRSIHDNEEEGGDGEETAGADGEGGGTAADCGTGDSANKKNKRKKKKR